MIPVQMMVSGLTSLMTSLLLAWQQYLPLEGTLPAPDPEDTDAIARSRGDLLKCQPGLKILVTATRTAPPHRPGLDLAWPPWGPLQVTALHEALDRTHMARKQAVLGQATGDSPLPVASIAVRMLVPHLSVVLIEV